MGGNGHFGSAHPVAGVAARLCERHLGYRRAVGLGAVACGACWEQAVRADERAVVLFDLPQEVTPDPGFVDEIAVELACRGERVALTPPEFVAAVQRLAGSGESSGRVAERLGVASRTVERVRAALGRRDATQLSCVVVAGDAA
jgi:hypothetical protein